MKIARLLLAALLLSLPSAVLAQIGTPPGIGNPPFSAGGTFTGPLRGPAGCTTPAYSFTGNPDSGVCDDGTFTKLIRVDGDTSQLTTRTAGGVRYIQLWYNNAAATASSVLGPNGAGSIQGATTNTVTGFNSAWAMSGPQQRWSFSGASMVQTPVLELKSNVAASTFLSFTNVAAPTQVVSLSQDSSLPSLTASVTDGTTTTEFLVKPTGIRSALTGAVTTTATLDVEDGVNTFLSFTNVAAPTKIITLTQDSSIPSLTTTVTDGTRTIASDLNGADGTAIVTASGATDLARITAEVNSSAITLAVDDEQSSAQMDLVVETTSGATVKAPFIVRGLNNGAILLADTADGSTLGNNVYRSLVNGGYALDGTTTASPASTVTVTLADPEADSAPTANVQVCGYPVDATALGLVTCETVAAVEGSTATAGTFETVLYIKSSGKAGDDADDTLAATFTTGAVSIRSATALVDSAKSDFTPFGVAPRHNYLTVKCLDLAGCDFQPADPAADWNDGRELQLYTLSGSTPIVIVDDDTLVELAGDANLTLDDKDTLRLIWVEADSNWAQTSASNN